jgi:ABC-type Zn uptake system ZnuABC Zn-binding protein ZnuA
MFRSRRLLVVLSVFMPVLVLAACSDSGGSGGDKGAWTDDLGKNDGRVKVVTSVAPISDIVRNIGGDRIALYGIVPDGTNSHTFEPKPSDAKVLSQADLILVNGLHLEEPTIKLAEANKKAGAEIKLLGENTVTEQEWVFDFSFPKEDGDPNPHLWMNPRYALRYAELAKIWLSERDAKNAAYYQGNYDRYKALIDQLDAGIRQAVQTVPQNNRRLLTYHDSWAYWAREYGWQVIGAVQPSDFSEPRPQDVAAIIDQIKKEQVPAVFGSEVFPSKTLEQIAKESGAKFIDELSDDAPPGKAGDANHTYVGMVLEDMRIMLTALGGNVDALKDIKPNRTFVASK